MDDSSRLHNCGNYGCEDLVVWEVQHTSSSERSYSCYAHLSKIVALGEVNLLTPITTELPIARFATSPQLPSHRLVLVAA